ncbi:two-component regulator propeller domain-containing protein [candidate division CSSED10-310 bacterium]|uniref:histidine kinase n=1 Tax=candidate division CSSED10-310 bacterium TaxID=2855610 RepID=A0ABV6Z0M0_UNCC1
MFFKWIKQFGQSILKWPGPLVIFLSFILLHFSQATPILFAQQYDLTFERITIDQGLSQSTVNSIIQDRKGFMWFGTDDGLNKYDGYRFTVYKNNPDNPKCISNDIIYSIYEDKEGTIWIGTNLGLNKFNPAREEFKQYRANPQDPDSLSNDIVMALTEDQAGTLWIGTDGGGLNKFDKQKETFIHYQAEPDDVHGLNHNTIRSIWIDRSGMIWIGTYGGGLNKFDPTTESFSHYTYQPEDIKSISSNIVWSICEDKAGFIWLGTKAGLNKFDPEDEAFTRYQHNPNDPGSLRHNSIYSIFEDSTDTLWVGTYGGGLERFDRDKEIFHHYLSNKYNSKSLSDNSIRSFYEDRSGVLWLGTDVGGISKTNRTGEKFYHIRNNPHDSNSLNDNVIWALYEDRDGLLWIGTNERGINTYNRKTNEFKHYFHEPGQPHSLSNNCVMSFSEDDSGTIWIGTYGGGLNKFDRERQIFTTYRHDPDNPESLISNEIRFIYHDQSDFLWLGTFNGLDKFDPQNDRFIHYQFDPNDPYSLSDNTVKTILRDRSGILWIGTLGGLNRYMPEKDNFTRYLADLSDVGSLNHNAIYSIYEDQSGVLWLGSKGGGLIKFERNQEVFTSYREIDGLPNDVIYGILEDESGNLWLSSNNGLSKFNPKTEEFKNYDVRDGLQSNEFNVNAFFKSKNGEMFFGGINGVNAFFPSQVKDNPNIPEIVITDFQLFNEHVPISPDSLLTQSITETEKIKLSYRDYVFSFEFAALEYSTPSKNQYAYIMEGFDDKWLYSGFRRFVTYTNLDPGHYVFRVKGSNNDGVWNEEGTAISITITPPPWKTWWAYVLYLFIALSLVFIYVRYKTSAQVEELKRQRKELEQERLVTERLRQVDKLKDEFLAITSHELRTPLNGIIGIAASLLDGVAGKVSDIMNSNLSMIVYSGKRLASLVNDILDVSKLKTQNLNLNLKPVKMHVITDIVLELSKPLLTGRDIILKNDVSPDLPAVVGDENRLQQIMHNLIGNALKFTDTGTITVSACEQRGYLEVSVTDTGIGIPEEDLARIFQSFEQVQSSTTREYSGTGLGLAITKQLVELHQGTIKVESVFGEGAKFTFTLPVSPDKAEVSISRKTVAKVREMDLTKSIPARIAEKDATGLYNILIVDDEPINQQVLINFLAFGNYQVTQAMDGEEALRILEGGQKFDLVLLDIMMPRMSGYEVCHRIRQKFLPGELPVIMITAKDQVSDLVSGLSSGANDYIAKPFVKDELLARIQTQLDLAKIHAIFVKFVPLEFLRTLGRERILDVQLGDQVQGTMTILFSDIRSYTSLSETMSPKENFNFLNAYLNRVGPIIRNNNGFVNQYFGDGMMALFPGKADDAVLAAIEMQKQVNHYNSTRLSRGRQLISIGIGLHTGSLMLGIIGDELRMDGSVVSDAVNSASRLEGLTKKYQAAIITSERTLKALKNPDQHHHRFLGKVQVKGKKEAVSIFEIFDADPDNIRDLKIKTKKDFETGLQDYFGKNFAKAVVSFGNILNVNADDKAAKLYLERSAKLIQKRVPYDWQGIEAIDVK